VSQRVGYAKSELGLGGWSVRSFDLHTLGWVDGLRPRCACEFQSRYGARRFYLHTRHGRLLPLPKRDAVYAAAMVNRVRLSGYDADTATLWSVAAAPLPEASCRAACMCAGAPAQFEKGRLVYPDVPLEIAALVLVAAGQPYPQATPKDTPPLQNR